eukprot:gb/GECH01010578.1/.p1 GENE.gb/GECH01010578.1/~~gb/GECH01010578.1/.p1  ORF type:complete len:291 (+),score=50.08 gb/GECH01010578.1/:1-873(+)
MADSKQQNEDGYISVALIAPPQVGKSSSLNSILKKINTNQAALVGEGTGIQGQNPTPYIFKLNRQKWVIWDFPGKYSNNIDEVLGFVDFCYSHDPVPNTDERHITDVVRETLRQLKWKQYPSIIVMVVDKNQILEDNNHECKDFYLRIKKRVKEDAHDLGEIPLLCIVTHKNAATNAENESEVNQKLNDFFQGILSTQYVFEIENNEACRRDQGQEEEHQKTLDKLLETMEVLHTVCERRRLPPPSYGEIIKDHTQRLQKKKVKLTSVLITFLSLLVLVLAINIAFSLSN